MNGKKGPIPIFFSIDNNYAPYLAAAVHSLIQNASKEYQYSVIVLHQGLSNENQKRIGRLAADDVSIRFVPIESGLEAITDRMSNRLRCDYFTMTIYFRLFIPKMFPEYDKGIYLDSDIIVAGDIAELFETDLGDNLIGASLDHSVQEVPELVAYMDKGVGVGHENYINSGILLMNLKRLREVQIDQEFLRLLTTYHFDTIAPDQDYLNVLCRGSIRYLDEVWDAMPAEGKPPLSHPKIIHYNLFSKPWCYDNIQYEDYFWKYAADCGYLEEILAHKKNYSEEQKKSDAECLSLLIKRGEAISHMPDSFGAVFGSGKEKPLK